MRGLGTVESGASSKALEVRGLNTFELMSLRLKNLQEEEADLKEALEILTKYPDMERLLTLMGKIRL